MWSVKSINELNDKSDDMLKLLVISHAIRVCTKLNKFSTANNFIKQLHTFDKEIDDNINIEMVMNEASYFLHADLTKHNMSNYYVRFVVYYI